MDKFNSDQQRVLELLNDKVIAMVAPSFVVDFDYAVFADELRAMGFDKVTELTFGAKEVNTFYKKHLQNNEGLWISSPCPSVVSLVKRKFPHLVEKLVPCVSPMIAMARILKKEFPDHKLVFVGPCISKKLEAKAHPEDVDAALTFHDVQALLDYFESKGKFKDLKHKSAFFDQFYNDSTKVYPISGGLANSMKVRNVVREDEYIIVDGFPLIEKVLHELDELPNHVRFVDILFCNGGCVGGPGVISKDPVEVKREKVLDYQRFAKKHKTGDEVGLDKYVEDLNFKSVL
jgi:iron only hydrogenase large subunit-like protein